MPRGRAVYGSEERRLNDESFQKAVMAEFAAMRADFGALRDGVRALRDECAAGFAKADRRMDALNARLDDVDGTLDDLTRDQVALRTSVLESTEVARRAIDRVHEMNRRIIRLEHPDE